MSVVYVYTYTWSFSLSLTHKIYTKALSVSSWREIYGPPNCFS
jgi:hypothetical protein